MLKKYTKNELEETLRIEEITRKGKKMVRIILVKYMFIRELSGSLRKDRIREPIKIKP